MFTYQINEETELKQLETRHDEQLFEIMDKSRESLREWLPWLDYNKTVEDSRKFIASTLKQYSENNGFQAGIWYQGELAGVVGLHGINWANRSTSLGYWLGKDFEGKGLMTRSCQAVIDYCFNELNLNRIEIRVAAENYKSRAIPERLGFMKEGHIRQAEWLYDKFVDHDVFGRVKADTLA
ncbi:ribosomal-protein-serine acetyltransferase [Sporosarcina luteola]|nr:ribosomal-protein-serine acetyltransferase [Sporosarcina luteola]